ncbi:MAG: alginate export family protein [Pseudomonadota bacterium]
MQSPVALREANKLLAIVLSSLTALPAYSFEAYEKDRLRAQLTINTRLGLQYGTGVNYGLGAFDSIGERERSTAYAMVKPKLDVGWELDHGEFFAGASVVAATTTLDGEISGQVARSGDEALDSDHAYVGWRDGTFELSVGGRDFWVGDGFIIGDGNFNQGGEDGQYWTGGFEAWRNSAILKINRERWRSDVFWLRTDQDLGDSRTVGVNVETAGLDAGTFGAMYLEVLEGNVFNLDGINAWNVRGHNVKVPGVDHLLLFGEWVLELGEDDDNGGRENNAMGWYVEGQYTFATLAWKPQLTFRYSHLSGDEADTPENEEYRGLFYTIFKRDWDTWYQGEIAGEYHLFNQNQVTKMFKLKAFPAPNWALTAYYYRHDLEEPQYFGRPVSSTDWADEINFGVEYFLGTRFYGYAGIAWSTPDDAAQELLGNDNFTVVQTFLSYTF